MTFSLGEGRKNGKREKKFKKMLEFPLKKQGEYISNAQSKQKLQPFTFEHWFHLATKIP